MIQRINKMGARAITGLYSNGSTGSSLPKGVSHWWNSQEGVIWTPEDLNRVVTWTDSVSNQVLSQDVLAERMRYDSVNNDVWTNGDLHLSNLDGLEFSYSGNTTFGLVIKSTATNLPALPIIYLRTSPSTISVDDATIGFNLKGNIQAASITVSANVATSTTQIGNAAFYSTSEWQIIIANFQTGAANQVKIYGSYDGGQTQVFQQALPIVGNTFDTMLIGQSTPTSSGSVCEIREITLGNDLMTLDDINTMGQWLASRHDDITWTDIA